VRIVHVMKRAGRLASVLLGTAVVSLISLASTMASATAMKGLERQSEVVSLGDTPYQPLGFGDAGFYVTSNVTYNKPAVGMASTQDGKGYWLVASNGGVFTFGDAVFYGSAGSLALNGPVVGIVATPDGKGYWLVAADGGVFAYGDAQWYGSMGGQHLNQPIVGLAATADGKGYWLVASDGGIFSFGDASYFGSLGATHLNAPIVGMKSSSDGYWLVASDGGVFTFGNAPFFGSMGGERLNAPVVGMASTPGGNGYWLVASDGGVFTFGNAQFYGSLGSNQPSNPVTAIAATPDGGGYWELPTIPAPPPVGTPSLGVPVGHFFYGTIGYGIVEPSELNNNGDPTSVIVQISWNSWGGSEAIGTGTAEYVGPSQTTSQGTDQSATIVAFDLGTCDGRYMYQAVEWYFPQHDESFDPTSYENICTGNFVENGVVTP
jgi:hypothetical protein